MSGCVPCFIIPLLLFIFHRYIQPLLYKFWAPLKEGGDVQKDNEEKKLEAFSCNCWSKTCAADDKKEHVIKNGTEDTASDIFKKKTS